MSGSSTLHYFKKFWLLEDKRVGVLDQDELVLLQELLSIFAYCAWSSVIFELEVSWDDEFVLGYAIGAHVVMTKMAKLF